jgi:hypothetical protein
VRGPALGVCPEGTSFNFEMGWTTMHTSRGLLQVQPDKILGKTLPFTLPSIRTLSTMWPEWILEDNCSYLSLQGRSVSHSHFQQSEGITDLLDLAAED